MNDKRVFENVAQEAEAWHDRRVAEIVGRDVDDSDGDGVASFGAFDVHRPGERMYQVEIDRSQILRFGIECQIGIKRVAGLEHEQLAGIDVRGWLDGVMIAIEAVRIILAVLAGFSDYNGGRQFDVAGIGGRYAPSTNQEQHCCQNFDYCRFLPNELVRHWMPSA